MKFCKWCSQHKPVDDFYKATNTADRRDPRCKSCRRITQRNSEKNYASKPGYKAARALKAKRARRSSIEQQLRNRIGPQMCRYLRWMKGGRSAFELVGYTAEQFRAHIEENFLPGMSWDNRRDWHIDHVRPLSSFVFTGPDDPQIRVAWGMANLRPLWAAENILKSNKWAA